MARRSVISSLSSFCNFRGSEVGVGTRTIRSHGASVANLHMYDWLILLLLVAIEVMLNVIHPFYRFVGKDMMTDLKYPLKENTVPIWAVPIYAILLPIAVFLFIYARRRCVYDLHHGILGLLFAVLITGVITDAVKDATGRPRPDFFWRCFPNGTEAYNELGNVICNGENSVIREGHKSFPSGHTSWSFAGLGFLSLYLSGKIKAFDRKGHVAKLCIVFLPLLCASLVAVSRVDDYWHHWQDVFAGGIIGLVVAIFCYLQFFPAPYDNDGWGPYAYFQAVEEDSRGGANTVHPMNGLSLHNMEEVQQAVEEDSHCGANTVHPMNGLSLHSMEEVQQAVEEDSHGGANTVHPMNGLSLRGTEEVQVVNQQTEPTDDLECGRR